MRIEIHFQDSKDKKNPNSGFFEISLKNYHLFKKNHHGTVAIEELVMKIKN